MTAPLEVARPTSAAAAFWHDGVLVSRDDLRVDPLTHTLHYGTGVFEGIRAYDTPRGPAIFRLREHMERLHRSAAAYRLAPAFDVDTLCEAAVATMRASGLRSAYIRPLVYFGSETVTLNALRSCSTHVMIAAVPFGGLHPDAARDGLRTTVSRTFMKTPSRALPATVKGSGQYTNSVIALHDAVERGFDEVLLLNDRGEIAEGSGENVFAVTRGGINTNDERADILLGITRSTVLVLAGECGIRWTVGPISERALRDADEAFLTGTAAGIVSVASLDDTVYADERPVTARLIEAYERATHGDDPRHADWVTFV